MKEKYFSSFRNSDGSYSLGKILGSDFNKQKLFNFIKDIGIFKKLFFLFILFIFFFFFFCWHLWYYFFLIDFN